MDMLAIMERREQKYETLYAIKNNRYYIASYAKRESYLYTKDPYDELRGQWDMLFNPIITDFVKTSHLFRVLTSRSWIIFYNSWEQN